MECDVQQRRLRRALDEDPPDPKLLGLDGRDFVGRVLRGDAREELLGQRVDFLGRDVAGEDHHAVVGRVVRAVERLEILGRPVLHIRRPAEDRELIRMRDVGGGHHLLVEQTVIVVVDARSALRVDDTALGLHDVRIDDEVLEPVTLQPEYRSDRGLREPVLIDGYVVRRIRVVRTARSLHDPVELARFETAGAVEHHVLEEVCKAGGTRILVAPAGTDEVVHDDVRNIVVGPDDNF